MNSMLFAKRMLVISRIATDVEGATSPSTRPCISRLSVQSRPRDPVSNIRRLKLPDGDCSWIPCEQTAYLSSHLTFYFDKSRFMTISYLRNSLPVQAGLRRYRRQPGNSRAIDWDLPVFARTRPLEHRTDEIQGNPKQCRKTNIKLCKKTCTAEQPMMVQELVLQERAVRKSL